MSLCDICTNPGQCCENFAMFEENAEKTFWVEGLDTVQKYLNDNGLPFEYEVKQTSVDGKYATYTFFCPELTDEGKCGIYKTRPNMCRRFKAGGESKLCIYGSDWLYKGSC